MTFTQAKWLTGFAYLFSILLGNLFVIWFGIVQLALAPVDFVNGPINPWVVLVFPAGAVWIGLTFSTRDFVQRFWGHWWCWAWMIFSGIITLFLNWEVAVASVAAFFVAEFTDWLIFMLLKKNLKWRLAISNLVSCPLDSIVFVTIAFGVGIWNPAVWGQALIKYLSGFLAWPTIDYAEAFYQKMKGKENI